MTARQMEILTGDDLSSSAPGTCVSLKAKASLEPICIVIKALHQTCAWSGISRGEEVPLLLLSFACVGQPHVTLSNQAASCCSEICHTCCLKRRLAVLSMQRAHSWLLGVCSCGSASSVNCLLSAFNPAAYAHARSSQLRPQHACVTSPLPFQYQLRNILTARSPQDCQRLCQI